MEEARQLSVTLAPALIRWKQVCVHEFGLIRGNTRVERKRAVAIFVALLLEFRCAGLIQRSECAGVNGIDLTYVIIPIPPTGEVR